MTIRAAQGDAPGGRAYCYACMKPCVTCICARVPRVANRTPVWVLQHPRERRHAIGTARLLQLGLEQLRLDVTFLSGDRGRAPSVPPGAALLYPSSDARELDSMAPEERPTQLIVLDGTWHHAHTIARELAWLDDVPRVKLRTLAPSRYRIRREPRAECLSTVEAVVAALRTLEPDTLGFDQLLSAFDSMIDDQIRFVEARSGPRRAKLRRRPGGPGLAHLIAEHWRKLLLVYVETVPAPAGERSLVQLAAFRPASAEPFDQVVGGPTPSGLFHMQLAAADFSDGIELPELHARWRDFRRPDDVVCVWNKSTLDLLDAMKLETAGLCLKAIWAGAVERAPGSLESVALRAQLSAPAVGVRGRAALRLGNAAAVAARLRERGVSEA